MMEMVTITPHEKVYKHDEEIPLPGKSNLAIRIRGVQR